mmetsp:Transcript_31001/g.73545  ORF Transcript_31001/g.73545 Transcript_31001/m.73545 type:complete len:225 (-) Transcript_31001:782-1456(-)
MEPCMRAPKRSLRFIVSVHGISANLEPVYTCWPTSSWSLTKTHSPVAETLRHSSISWQGRRPPFSLEHEPTKVARAALSSGTMRGGGSLWNGMVIPCAAECLGHPDALAVLSASELVRTLTSPLLLRSSHSALCAGTSVDITTMRSGHPWVMRRRSSSKGPRSDRHGLWARAKYPRRGAGSAGLCSRDASQPHTIGKKTRSGCAPAAGAKESRKIWTSADSLCA